MIRPEYKTETLLLSITKSCESPIKETHTKPQETLDFTPSKSKETFQFSPTIPTEGYWMVGLTSLEVHNSVFEITQENSNFELYKFPDSKNGGISYEKVRDEIEKDLEMSYTTATNLQDKILGQILVEEHREQVAGRMKNDE